MKKRRGLADRGSSRKSRNQSVPWLERVEDRVLMAIFNVTSTNDNLNAVAGDGTLRGEILSSNAVTTANEIDFMLPSGVQTIALKAPLPTISTQLFINGTTATGFTNTPLIQVTGTNPQFQATGPAFTITAANSEIRDLVINNFQGDAIDLSGNKGIIDGDYIGLDPTGTKAEPNTNDGILVTSANNTIGGGAAPNPNVISSNGGNGIEISSLSLGGNLVAHNYIGTNAAGTAAVFSKSPSVGIAVASANNTIGGFLNGTAGALNLGPQGNLISGNSDGIDLLNGSAFAQVEGNFIGTDVTGKVAVPNTGFGVYINSGTFDTVGGSIIGNIQSNVISGNGGDGVRIQGANAAFNAIEGNYIGVGSDGSTAIGNAGWGVQISGSSGNLVGVSPFQSSSAQFGNIIQHNATLGGAGGVTVVNGSGDGILSNSIYQNGKGPGIKLVSANGGVQPPTLTSVQSGAGQTRIVGTYFGAKNTQYLIQFFSSMLPNASGIGDGENYLPFDYPLTTDRNGNATINAMLTQQVPVGYYVTATATQAVQVTNNTSNFSTAVLAAQAVVADLSVTTAVPTTGPELDQPYTYTITVTNGGPNDTSDAVLTDTLPANSTVVSVSGGTVTAGVLTDDLGPLAANASDTVTIVVKPIKTGAFNNTAVVSGPDLDPDMTNNTSTTTATAVPDSDLSVVLTPASTSAPVGSPLNYTLAISNFGPSTATGTVATIQFPADFTGILVNPDQGSYTVSGTNLVTINTGILPASSTSIVTISATPTQVESAVTTAAVTSPLADPNPNNNTTSATVTISNAADLGVSIAANPDPAQIGQDLVYTVTLFNNGPSAASEPVVTDPLPAGVTYDPNNSSAGPNGVISFANGVVTASMNALLAGGTDTITIAVIPSATGVLNNTVSVGDPTQANPVEIDPDLGNNQATVSVPVSPADLSVTVINPNDPLFIGKLANFEVQVQNAGPSTATNVILTDSFGGAGGIFLVSTGQYSGNNYKVNLGTLAPGQVATVYLIYDPSHSGTLTDQAAVTSDQYDPDTSNNTSSSTNLVSPVDLGVSVATSTSQALFGTPVSYTITVTNFGPATATNVLIADTLPADAILQQLAASQGEINPNSIYSIVYGNLGSIASGASATVTFTVLPLSLGAANTSASVFSDDFDTNPSNNTASTSATVFNQPGTISFTTTLQTVNDTAGGLSVILHRTDGSAGTVTVTYYTTDYTAVSGVNYIGGSGTVTFQPNQFFAAIPIPVLNSQRLDGNHGFFVNIVNPSTGAAIGSPSATGVLVVNTNRDLVPPVITSLLAIPNGNFINGFVLTFDKALDPTRASLLSNYYVFRSTSGAINSGTPVPLVAAQYNASNHTVILVPPAPLPSNTFYEVIANGTVGTAITDASGNLLSGSSGPGSNYLAYYGQGTKLTYDDSQNNVVTLNLTGGGIMGIFRSSNGDATVVNLYGIVPHATKLSGSVTKLNKYGSGHTTIGAINGFGQFGSVKSTLTTPQFYVGSAPVSASSVGVGVPVSLNVAAESVTTPKVTPKKVTPKGPKHAKH